MAHLFGWQPHDLARLLPEELLFGIEYLEEVNRDGPES